MVCLPRIRAGAPIDNVSARRRRARSPPERRPVDAPCIFWSFRWSVPHCFVLPSLTRIFYAGENIWGRGSIDDKSGVIGILYVHLFRLTETDLIDLVGRQLRSSSSRASRRRAPSYSPLGSTRRPADTMYAVPPSPSPHVLTTRFTGRSLPRPRTPRALRPRLVRHDRRRGLCVLPLCLFSIACANPAPTAGFSDAYGAIFASPGVAEKGFANVNIEVQTPGGHSRCLPFSHPLIFAR
jgi:hypothetical protein